MLLLFALILTVLLVLLFEMAPKSNTGTMVRDQGRAEPGVAQLVAAYEVERGRRQRALLQKRLTLIAMTMLLLFKMVSCEEGVMEPPLLRAGVAQPPSLRASVALGTSQVVTTPDEAGPSGLPSRDEKQHRRRLGSTTYTTSFEADFDGWTTSTFLRRSGSVPMFSV